MVKFFDNIYGIVYTATGKKYQHECVRSIDSLRLQNKVIPIAVFTESPQNFACMEDPNLHVMELGFPSYSFQDKIQALSRSPFKKTLLLDSDTIILNNPECIFEILNRFDIAVSAETYRPSQTESIPECFPEFNTGVVAIDSSNPAVMNFLQDWSETFTRGLKSSNRPKHDQPSFREALYRSSLRLCTISNEWNFHIAHPIVLNAGAQITVLHTRLLGKDIKRQINKSYKGSHVFLPSSSCIHPDRIGSANRRLDFWLRVFAIPFRIGSRLFRSF
jgi:hypothetical protein